MTWRQDFEMCRPHIFDERIVMQKRVLFSSPNQLHTTMSCQTAMAQCFLPYKVVQERWTEKCCVEWLGVVQGAGQKKGRGSSYEITIDGVAVSLLYSKEIPSERAKTFNRAASSHIFREQSPNSYIGWCMGLDQGKKNIATMVDNNGVTLLSTDQIEKLWKQTYNILKSPDKGEENKRNWRRGNQ